MWYQHGQRQLCKLYIGLKSGFNEKCKKCHTVLQKLYPLQILAASLLRLKGRAVGVVGLAHLDGIERIWREKIL